jgi:sugar phosphate isomerase/epimerase
LILYVPTLAARDDDLARSLELLGCFGDRERPTGLMLVPRAGFASFRGDERERQLQNLERRLKGREDLRFIVMAPSLPLEELDLYHRPDVSVANLRQVIDFAAALPGAPIVTFHLNTLFTPEEWAQAGKTPEERQQTFERIWSQNVVDVLASIVRHGRERGVALKLETTPVPEFGDRRDRLNLLGNPYPIYSGRGITEVRLGIALDLCHTYTLFKAAASFQETDAGFFDVYKGLFPRDLPKLRAGGLLTEVLSLEPGDVVHLNDSRGLYDPGRGLFHEEGVALGEGEIEDLPRIVQAVARRDLHVVFEVNETDYDARPNLRRSIEYFLRHAS